MSQSTVDVSALIGPYPYRELPHPDPGTLIGVLDREEIATAWVGHLPTAFHRDPRKGNESLYRDLAPHRNRLDPAPTIRPDWPDWERELRRARDEGAVAIRAYPQQWGYAPEHAALLDLARACATLDVPLLFTVRFEDARQRHTIDGVGDLPAAVVRAIARAETGVRIVVTAAGRAMIEEVHWGLTPLEREFVWYDTSWIWGPPEDDFAHLVRSLGGSRFVYGTGWPLRLAQVTRANLRLLPPDLWDTRLVDPSTWTAR